MSARYVFPIFIIIIEIGMLIMVPRMGLAFLLAMAAGGFGAFIAWKRRDTNEWAEY